MTQVFERERELHRDVADAVGEARPDVEVLAVELGGPELLWVYIDHAEGVDHALCEEVTGLLNAFRTDFTLNVSSPGLDRPLRMPAHFANVQGQRVSLRTAVPIEGRKRFKGEVLDASEQSVTVVTADGQTVEVPYEKIVRGNLIDEGR